MKNNIRNYESWPDTHENSFKKREIALFARTVSFLYSFI